MFKPDQLDHDIFHPRHEDSADSYHNIVQRMDDSGILYPPHVTFGDRKSEEKLAYYDYFNWLNRTVRGYLKDPKDFIRSWYFIDAHPAFWYQPRPEDYPNQWATSSGIAKMWINVTSTNEGTPLIMLEHGRTVPGTNYTYHDHYLDVYDGSYEDAIIAMAARVYKYYGIDGDPFHTVGEDR